MDKFLKFGAVGVIDSGIGGLTVLNELSKTFPKLNFVYYGDNENAPYGNKSIDELKKLVLKGIDNLLLFNVKIIVVACNTLSTTLFDYIKAVSPVPVIFTLPNSSYDTAKFKTPCLIATPNTISSNYVKTNFKNFNLIPLPFLAGEIERYILSPTKICVEKDLTALLSNVDYLYLGCTHYIFIKDRIKKRFPNLTVADNLTDVVLSFKNTLPSTTLNKVNRGAQIKFIGNSSNYNFTVFKVALWSKNDTQNCTCSLILG